MFFRENRHKEKLIFSNDALAAVDAVSQLLNSSYVSATVNAASLLPVQNVHTHKLPLA